MQISGNLQIASWRHDGSDLCYRVIRMEATD